MSIACPYCGASLNPKGAKPGHFKPKCPKCQQTFALTVSDDPDDPFTVERLDADPLPATKAVPLAKLRAREFSDDDEEAAEAPEGEGDSEDIANGDDSSASASLPKTSPYPMVRPKHPPADEEDE
ncbi:serine threonine protein kinase : Serine/threonine protein kinase OS=Pirellula staleyi (strain ATCC 27377 / DSM 6068 / ICPB 4128) GN=Psta_1107 PE=3 SV=1 [Gemmataceae bacterium]|nr:serine threonine protein kinase : Serine/threonine protein kinase OS=Pirellula staleyi (strain ATCC 27377 / DSM 6068 / ICPB 4128) GN=Psta_1107 PE=3 SV=1 [Gemmataceae bacterium]VTT98117.1 serine threonine protein kinase : Serine/threonine protein kinase OS=Pirellula staleyi (strain ATCC 27377 / DSM 6068 / ICPB 4128) GN=Psta_1107 PE=3 SV=1 [Gemmataceae bacterium]